MSARPALQQSIFALGETAVDPEMAGLVRQRLAGRAWVDYLPNWVSGDQALFDTLEASVQWHRHRRQMYERVVDVPRLTGSSPGQENTPHPILGRIPEILSNRYGRPLTSLSYALYRNGEDSVAMHGDKVGRLADDCVVAIVSVGAPRRFLLREVDGPGALTFELGWGDLLVMGGACQRTWRHGVPKVRRADPRMSIMFRQSLTSLVAPQLAPRLAPDGKGRGSGEGSNDRSGQRNVNAVAIQEGDADVADDTSLRCES